MTENITDDSQRDAILAHFQDVTSLADVDRSVQFLEMANWQLQDAVQLAFAAGLGHDEQPGAAAADLFDAQIVDENIPRSFVAAEPPPSTNDANLQAEPSSASITGGRHNPWQALMQEDEPAQSSAASSSNNHSRKHIHFDISGDETTDVDMLASSTVGELYATVGVLLDLDPQVFELFAWPCPVPATRSLTLQSLRLPSTVNLRLIKHKSNSTSSPDTEPTVQELAQDYALRFTVQGKDGHTLHMKGSDTIAEVKRRVASLTNVACRKQKWTGWPCEDTDVDRVLASCGLDNPVHSFSVQSTANATTSRARRVSSDSSDDDMYELASTQQSTTNNNGSISHAEYQMESDVDVSLDDSGSAPRSAVNRLPLIPEDPANVGDALQNFAAVFEQRYGAEHTSFYQGPLQVAVADAFDSAATCRRPLLLYLHNDNSIAHNVFCQQIMCSSEISQLMNRQFLTWPWDMTAESNADLFRAWASQLLPAEHLQMAVRMRKDRFPLLLVFGKERQIELLQVIDGTMGRDQVMQLLLESLEMFQNQQKLVAKEELDRHNREQFRREQQSEYEQALASDKAKEEEKIRQMNEQEASETQKQQELLNEQTRRAALASSLPEEPAEGSAGVVLIRLRVPTGPSPPPMRRFAGTHTVQHLVNWADSLGYSPAVYKMLTSDRPSRNLCDLDQKGGLAAQGIPAREQITIEEI